MLEPEASRAVRKESWMSSWRIKDKWEFMRIIWEYKDRLELLLISVFKTPALIIQDCAKAVTCLHGASEPKDMRGKWNNCGPSCYPTSTR
jgi:hypothetical protein